MSPTLKYAILYAMRTSRTEWIKWAETLHRFRLDSLAAWFLEAGEPMLFLGAQALYFGEPFLGKRSSTLAGLLEDQDETRAFATFLREDATS